MELTDQIPHLLELASPISSAEQFGHLNFSEIRC